MNRVFVFDLESVSMTGICIGSSVTSLWADLQSMFEEGILLFDWNCRCHLFMHNITSISPLRHHSKLSRWQTRLQSRMSILTLNLSLLAINMLERVISVFKFQFWLFWYRLHRLINAAYLLLAISILYLPKLNQPLLLFHFLFLKYLSPIEYSEARKMKWVWE